MITIRNDDFDFRLSLEEYVAIHEEFIKRGLIETAVIQFTSNGQISNYPQELIDYMKTAPNYDLQLHGWAHEHYDTFPYQDIFRSVSACFGLFGKLFDRKPTIWFPPWNAIGVGMIQVAEYFGLKIDNESYDICKFIRDVTNKTYSGHSFYFHGWNQKEMIYFQQALDLAAQLGIDKEEESGILKEETA